MRILLALAFTFVSSTAFADTSEFERGYNAGLAACPVPAPGSSIWICQASNSVNWQYRGEYDSRTEYGRGSTRVQAIEGLIRECGATTTHVGCVDAIYAGNFTCKEL